MSRNTELDTLRSKEQCAFRRKQRAWDVYADAKNRSSDAHDAMDLAWRERVIAKEVMNSEFEELQRLSRCYREVWDKYQQIRDECKCKIEQLLGEANVEHQKMIKCFEKANSCYECGNKAEAPNWSKQGYEHKEYRDKNNAEIKRLSEEIKTAKRDARLLEPKVDSSAFRKAKENFENAKSRHKLAQAEFEKFRDERDCARTKFDSAMEEHAKLKMEFQQKLKEVSRKMA